MNYVQQRTYTFHTRIKDLAHYIATQKRESESPSKQFDLIPYALIVTLRDRKAYFKKTSD